MSLVLIFILVAAFGILIFISFLWGARAGAITGLLLPAIFIYTKEVAIISFMIIFIIDGIYFGNFRNWYIKNGLKFTIKRAVFFNIIHLVIIASFFIITWMIQKNNIESTFSIFSKYIITSFLIVLLLGTGMLFLGTKLFKDKMLMKKTIKEKIFSVIITIILFIVTILITNQLLSNAEKMIYPELRYLDMTIDEYMRSP